MCMSSKASSKTRDNDTKEVKMLRFYSLRTSVLSLIRDSRQAQVPASSGRTRDAPETPQKHECPRGERPHLPPSRRLSRSLPPKAPIREATIPRLLLDRLSSLRRSPRLRRSFAPCQPTPRHRRSQTRSPFART